MRRFLAVSFLVLAATLGGCGYNDFQRLDEQVNADWSGVLAQYQRRADLVPNIVATVKGEANFEQETLTNPNQQTIEAAIERTSLLRSLDRTMPMAFGIARP